jgi:hypothetical protein
VLALRYGERLATQLTVDTILVPGAELLVPGSGEHRRAFAEASEQRH